MKGRLSIAILCLILANSPFHVAPAAAGSSERVHIRLHMPEIVRKHTHFHKVYKLLPPAMEPTIEHHPYSHSSPSSSSHQFKNLLPTASASASHGKPHVSLLGYTTTASGTGVLSPNLMQLMASAATPMTMSVLPTLTPNYGPALFDNFNQEVAATTTTTTATPATSRPSGSGGNYLATAPGSTTGKSSQQQLLQQIFTPNILAAISASQQQRKKHQQHSYSNNIDMQSEPESESEPEPEVENNELLNGNFLAALQHEYFNKFGSGTRKRKKIHFRSNYRRPSIKPTSNYVQESEEHYDDYAEESPTSPTGYEDQPEPTPPSAFGNDDDDTDEAAGYDSAAAFSGQSNGMTMMPTVDDFLSDVNSNSYTPFYGNTYDDYGPSSVATGNNNWHSSPPPTFSTYARPTKATPPKLRLRQTRPTSTMSSGKVRYVKLTTRKKRKNRIKSKRYLI